MLHEFTCSVCKEHKTHESDISTGYGRDMDNNIVCFECCGKQDAINLEQLKPTERMCLYLDTKLGVLTNWPASLKIPITNGYIKTGRHNIAGRRYDTWFKYAGNNYHAVQYGDNTQVAHIRRLKSN